MKKIEKTFERIFGLHSWVNMQHLTQRNTKKQFRVEVTSVRPVLVTELQMDKFGIFLKKSSVAYSDCING